MGIFDGYLILTDLDNTFRSENSVDINSGAVEYFKNNGGKFTFATGRSIEYLRTSGILKFINAPACLCNGGLIYDYEKEKILVEERLNYTFDEFLEEIGSLAEKVIRWNLFYESDKDSLLVTNLKDITFNTNIKLIKIVSVFENAADADEFKNYALNSKFFNNTYISKSWVTGVEFNSVKATKGCAVEYIKNYIGNIHTTIGAGDYENDFTLLECADIGVAPENALDLIKEKADYIVCHAKDGAIKEIIEKIEKGELSRKSQ